ncbi:hypothetical protein [Rhodovulum sulfidophilum]|uniref:hypothetical protein n=1 Tax=Rhodovulum sulfidophilum TaxID=35806 RepID=UPI00117B7E62|nr:hypothetical protein [Rhodovulum sulfidophilum]MBL3554159.1 hypothetical protein [Rhodovulum sulfidophilum]
MATVATGPVSAREREYYTDMPCAEGQGCGGEGVVLPFDQGNVALDEMFGFTDVEDLPLSDEVLPVIFDGALLTEDGLLDCFARHYPERAGFLLQLLSDEGDLALGYRLEFLDDATQAAPMREALRSAQDRYNEVAARQQQLRGSVRSQLMMGGHPGAEMTEGQDLENEAITLRNRIRDLETQLSRLGRWDIDDSARVVRVYTTINRNVERAPLAEYVPGGDDGINPLPTNKEGADWLNAVMGDWMARNGYPGAGSEEEFFRNWLTRNAAGVALVGLGAIEMFGGVTVAIGSGGLAAVGGVALTVVGFDTLSQGAKMLWTPDRHSSERGWIGDLVHDTATRFGGEETAQAFDRGWAVTQILAGFGAPVVIRYAATRATRVAASGKNIRPIVRGQLDEARLGIAEVKGHRFGDGLVGDYAALPSGRGAIIDFPGVGRMRLPTLDSDMRVLLRLRGARAGQVQERSRELGQGMAGFARGPITDQGKAIAFVHEVGRHMGLNAADITQLLRRIEFGQRRSSAFNDRRVLHLRQGLGTPLDGLGPYNELRAFTEVAHELNHALTYQRYIARGGNPQRFWRTFINPQRAVDRRGRTIEYYEEEVRIERLAIGETISASRRAIADMRAAGQANDAMAVRRLLSEAIQESRDYIDDAKDMLGQ